MKKLGSKEVAEKFVDAILKKLPKEHLKRPKKPTEKRVVDRMTAKMLKALHGIDSLVGEAVNGNTGACCLNAGGCQITTAANCVNGSYKGDGTDCSTCSAGLH